VYRRCQHRVLFSEIQITENNLSLINISEQYDVEHVDIVDSDLDLTDNSLSSISISNSVANVQLDGSSTISTIESSIFNIKTTTGDDAFYLESNIAYGGNLVALNASNSEQTGTGVMVSIAGKIGYQGVIDGNAGLDSVHLSDRSEAFFIHDAFSDFHDTQILTEDEAGMLSTQRFKNIENIFAGGGNDIIDLTSPEYLIDVNGMHIFGESGDDVIWGTNKDQYLSGGSGNDILFGGNGDDFLHGGTGADVFEFVNDITNGHDTISDFSVSDDKIKIYISQNTDRLSTNDFTDNVLSLNGSSVTFDTSDQLSFETLAIEYYIS
jgi:Ca2+-binding RTX toxin-like protein